MNFYELSGFLSILIGTVGGYGVAHTHGAPFPTTLLFAVFGFAIGIGCVCVVDIMDRRKLLSSPFLYLLAPVVELVVPIGAVFMLSQVFF